MLNNLSILNLIITIALALGGVMAYRHSFAKTVSEIQDRVINALKTEIDTLKDELNGIKLEMGELKEHMLDLEKENSRLRMVITAIVNAMKRRKIIIDIDKDIINIKDETSGTVEVERIQEQSTPSMKEV